MSSRTNKKTRKIKTHDQWIEITIENGKTVTRYYPPNAEFERLRRKMDPPPDLIYRRLNFLGPVPRQYAWTHPEPQAAMYGGHCLIRLKTEEWLRCMSLEQLTPHVMAPLKSEPRPEQFGPCPCARCTRRREEQEALEDQQLFD